MAKRMVVIAGLITLITVMAILAEADVPQLISFQGKLYDDAGNPLTGEYEITFRIYDVAEGGAPLWSETDSVECDGGLYNVILGLNSPLNLDFGGHYWLGMQVTGDVELSPRFRLVSVPTAFRAAVADSAVDSDKLDGKHASAFADSAHQHDERYYTQDSLKTSDGDAPNVGSNVVHWDNLWGLPAGFADGTDDVGAAGGVSQINAGTAIEVTNPTGPTATVAHAADASALPGAHHTKTTDASELTSGILDTARFSAYSDLDGEGKIGAGGDQVATGDHNHDAAYVNEGQANSITSAMIADSAITDADISDTAAIDPSKISGTAWTSDNDGAGSGLDADMVDGKHADAFADSVHQHDERYYSETELNTNDGAVNDTLDPVSWYKIKDIPVGFADGTDDVGAAGGVSQINAGTAIEVTNPTGPTATVAHAADASALPNAHHTKTTDASELTSGVLDTARLNMSHGNGIDADMVDGKHADAFADSTHAHDGSEITSGTIDNARLNTGSGNGLDADMVDGKHADAFADSAHQHDDRYYTETELNTNDGTVNQAEDPVSWYKIKDMPAGFADGTDDEGAAGGWVDDGTVIRLETGTDSVGIGTTSPNEKLEVSGNILLQKGNKIEFGVPGTGEYITQEESTPYGLQFFAGHSEVMRVANTGNVGIGTTSPGYKLTVSGGDLVVVNDGNNPAIVAMDSPSDYVALGWDSDSDYGAIQTIQAENPGNLTLQPIGGNVSIGPISPTEKLDVAGNIHASGTIESGSSIVIDGVNDKITADTLELHVASGRASSLSPTPPAPTSSAAIAATVSPAG